MLSLLFIRRPKTAAVISIALFIAGAICALRLPIAEYPTVAPPQVEVSAFYAGASADEIASTVAAPIESEINSVEDLIYFDSKSDNAGNYTLTVTFKPGANENMALVNVNNAVKLVEPKLAIPLAALVFEGEKRVVYVVKDGKAEKRPVSVGEQQGDRILVESGLAADESFVTAGTHKLRDGCAVAERGRFEVKVKKGI